MKLMNLMLGKGKGGLEQAAVDYHEALAMAGHEVLSVVHPHAAVRSALEALPGRVCTLRALGEWDMLATARLARMARREGVQMALCHGNRAIGLALRGLQPAVAVVGVAHNYNIRKRFPRCDAVFCITRDLLEEMVHLNIERARLCHIPNLIRAPGNMPQRPAFRSPPVVGAMGRFVAKKGFDVLVQAVAALHHQGVPLRCRIAGDGEEKDALIRLMREHGVDDVVELVGWVDDKQAFFDGLDMFVLPSHHEPFGIVLIEAMAQALPCITTDTEGPCEIIHHEHDAVMIEKDKPYAMAHAIGELLDDMPRAVQMGQQAYLKVRDVYAIEKVSQRLDVAVQTVLALSPQT